MNQRLKYFRLIFILSLLVIVIIYALHIPKLTLKDLLDFTPESPVLAALALLGIYCLKVIIMFIPLVMLYVVAGIIFPPGWAIVITYFCLTVEMTLGFFIGRRLGSKRVLTIINKSDRAKKIMEFGCNNSLLSCLIIRLIPGPPVDLTNMFIGTTDVKYPQFIVGTLLGLTPNMIPLVLMGEAAANPLSPQFLISFAVIMAVTVSLAVGYHLWHEKLKTRTNND